MESSTGGDQVFDPDRVPKELWNLILGHLSVEKKIFPVFNEIEFVLPFLKLVSKRFYQAVKDYVAQHKINEKSNNRRLATIPVLAAWGALSCIKLLQEYGLKLTEGTCEMAARGGHLEVLKYSRENGCVWNVSSMYRTMSANAIMSGKIEVLQYIQEHNCSIDSKACDRATDCGRLDMYKHLRSMGHGIEDFHSVIRGVVSKGYVDILKHFCEVEKMFKQTDVHMLLNEDCHVDCLKYLHSVGYPFHYLVCVRAAENGNLAALKFAHENKAEFTRDVVVKAATNGHFECLKYAIENGCPVPKDICNFIVGGNLYNIRPPKSGSLLKCLKLVHEHGAEFDNEVASVAARYGALDCLKYLHEHGARWNETVYINALSSSHMDCIKYARENGCPWSTKVFDRAIKWGTEEQLQYLVQEGCPVDQTSLFDELKNLLPSTIKQKLKLLKKLGVPVEIDLQAVLAARQQQLNAAYNPNEFPML